MRPALIRREPVLNRQKAITASRLIVHADSTADAAAALNKLVDIWPKVHSVFVGLAGLTPDQDLLTWQAPENILLEIPATALSRPEDLEFIKALVGDGVPLVLDGYMSGTTLPPGVPFRFLLADAHRQPKMPKPPGVTLATGLTDIHAFSDAVFDGYDGAAGWFFLHGRPPGNKLNPSHAQIIRVLNLVRRNAEVKEIEAALKQDVTLSYKLLRYINSAGFGLSCEIESFRHAVAILGYAKLNKWLSLLLVTASRDPAAAALMQTAIARGRLMELLGQEFFDRAELDNLFITGAFSLLDVLLGAPLEAVLDEMSLPDAITDALLRHQGAYAPLLDLAFACEGGTPAAIIERIGNLGIGVEKFNHAQVEALTYADSIQFN